MRSAIGGSLLPLLAAGVVACGGGRSGGGPAGTAAVSAREELGPAASTYTRITAAELREMMAAKHFVLVNVHVPDAGDIPETDLRIPYNEIAANVDRLPADTTANIVVYCRSGHMSAEAAETLAWLGYTNVYDLEGGMQAWVEAGYALEGAVKSPPVFSAQPDGYAFGRVPINGGDVATQFVVTNVADRPVRLQRVYTSCGCTTASLAFSDGTEVGRFGMPGHDLPTEYDRVVQPGEEFEVRVLFDPAAHGPNGIGTVSRSIMLEPADEPALEFVFTVTVFQP